MMTQEHKNTNQEFIDGELTGSKMQELIEEDTTGAKIQETYDEDLTGPKKRNIQR